MVMVQKTLVLFAASAEAQEFFSSEFDDANFVGRHLVPDVKCWEVYEREGYEPTATNEWCQANCGTGHVACSATTSDAHRQCAPCKVGDSLLAGFPFAQDMPLNKELALETGWEEVGSGCHQQFGHQFQRNGLLAPTLMFANTGHIAGMQFAIDSNTFPLYPQSNLRKGVNVHETDLPDGHGDYALTVYFMDPAKMCTADYTDHTKGSLGDRLWRYVLDGYEKIPLSLPDYDQAPENFFKGGCLPAGALFPGSIGMGTHFWEFGDRVQAPENACEDISPFFFMHSAGKLSAFGAAFGGLESDVPTVDNVRPTLTPRGNVLANQFWGFPLQAQMAPTIFLEDQVPACTDSLNLFNAELPYGNQTMSVMHIYVRDPSGITCP